MVRLLAALRAEVQARIQATLAALLLVPPMELMVRLAGIRPDLGPALEQLRRR